jgi:lysophospholipase L1-like esterase
VSGQPRRELFLEDGLHMNAKGYAIWRDLVTPVLR